MSALSRDGVTKCESAGEDSNDAARLCMIKDIIILSSVEESWRAMARRPPPPQPTAKKRLTSEEMSAGIARLHKRLEEVEAFNANTMQERRPPELMALETGVMRALERTFGENTADLKRFAPAGMLTWSPRVFTMGQPTPLQDFRRGVGANVERSKALLKEAIRTLEEDIAEAGGGLEELSPAPSLLTATQQPRRVFIVHGHDEGARETIARFLEQLGLEAVILHEQPNKGRTIITKFREEAADIGFAVVLMTPDDHGGKAGAATSPRSRQNVVFELGFFIGALGPEKVAALVKGDVEKPSDFDGVVYISLDQGHWKIELAKELRAAGFEVDFNRIIGA